MGDIITRGSDEKEISHLCLRKLKIQRFGHSDQKLDEILEVKTREKLILQMLDTFKKLRSSNSSNHLTVEEMRLYMLMDEHIYLSLWVSGSGREKPQGSTELKSDEVTGKSQFSIGFFYLWRMPLASALLLCCNLQVYGGCHLLTSYCFFASLNPFSCLL